MATDLDSNRQPWPIPHDRVRQRLEDLSASSPRFLFRAWNEISGGADKYDVAFDEETAIRPKYFALHPPEGTYSMYNLSRNQLGAMCTLHLDDDRAISNETMFTSWSHEIQTCLSFCRYYDRKFISVIDVTKLKPENVVLYTPKLREIVQFGIPHKYTNEFLIFGVIEGDALSCVSFADIESAGLQLLLPQNMNRTFSATPGYLDDILWFARESENRDGYVEQALYGTKAWPRGQMPGDFNYYMGIAWKIGKLYSRPFRIAVAIAFVCLAPWHCVNSQVVFPEWMLAKFSQTEAEWVADEARVHQDFRFQSIEVHVRSPWKMALFLIQQAARQAEQLVAEESEEE